MKVKIGTTMDEQLYGELQACSQAEGTSISQLIEAAVRGYLARRADTPVDRVCETYGQYQVSPETLRQLLDDDLYDA